MNRINKWIFAMGLPLVLVLAGPGGCNSVYHQTLKETTPVGQGRLADRLAEARQAFELAGEQFRYFIIRRQSAAAERELESSDVRQLRVVVDRADLRMSEARRYRQAVGDVVELRRSEGPPVDQAAADAAFVAMDRAEAAMRTALEQMRASLPPPESAQATLPAVASSELEDAVAATESAVQEVIERINAFLARESALG